MKAQNLLKRPYVDLPLLSKKMKPDELDETRQRLEAIAQRAAFMAAYLEERQGYGCGDQGHAKALKSANHAARTVWMKAFGYNAYHDLSF